MSNTASQRGRLERLKGQLGSLSLDRESYERVVKALRRRKNQVLRTVQLRMARTQVPLPKFAVPDGPVARPGLRVGVILDTFTELALAYEWQQVLLTPDGWRDQLDAETLDLLFVESAWHGNGDLWKGSMTGTGEIRQELAALIAECRDRGIPTVFWNKEDPPNYDRFLDTARQFDHVFTVDEGKLPDYRRDLGHDRVGVLPFGAQPRIHNPIRTGQQGPERPFEVAFAGTYFAEKHPERRRQMEMLLPAAFSHDLHIFSRMQTEDPRYRFPGRYTPYLKGSLSYEETLSAYRSYKVFLNVNSVVDSATMCPRRLFELSASQAAVLSTPAPSIAPVFGENIVVVEDAESAKEQLSNLLAHREWRDRLALRAHRAVHDSHLYGHRIDTVLDAVGIDSPRADDSISVVVPTMRTEKLDNVWSFLHRQVHPRVELVLVTHGFELAPERLAELQAAYPLGNVVLRSAGKDVPLGGLMNIGVDAASGQYVAKMDDDNYYAPHYLSDLVRAFSWTDAQVVGKWAHYVHIGDDSGPTLLRFADAEHQFTRLVQGGTILTPREVAATLRFEPLPRRVDTTFLDKVRAQGGRVYSGDRFNFISTRTQDATGHTWGVSTAHLLSHSSTLEFYGPAEAHVTV